MIIVYSSTIFAASTLGTRVCDESYSHLSPIYVSLPIFRSYCCDPTKALVEVNGSSMLSRQGFPTTSDGFEETTIRKFDNVSLLMKEEIPKFRFFPRRIGIDSVTDSCVTN